MKAIITGDIINSREKDPKEWMKQLKAELDSYGKNPKNWEIFKGDSFQVEVSNVFLALLATIKLKAAIKKLGNIDVRLSIGIGSKTYKAKKISESNGTAFVNSGEAFESLREKKQNILIKSPWAKFDNEMNLFLRLALIVMDNWTQKSAEIVHLTLQKSELNQEKLGKCLKIGQNAISQRLHRAHYYDLMALNDMFQAKLKENLK
ncbi:MAG: hypothetical protein SFU25_10350 [Candidatus Caenarcaniphilales bacterium]|nr:hypothetical protein [Candidatus Caenarcaniphilales bacterium]